MNETLTWRPNWADAEVANKVIGVGLAFNFKRTHIGYVDVEIDPYSNGQFVGLDAEVSASTNRYIMELKPEFNFTGMTLKIPLMAGISVFQFLH